jgi:hypothetical protein
MSGEFGGEWRAQDINIVHFGRSEIEVASEGLMYHNIVQYVDRENTLYYYYYLSTNHVQ